MLQWIRPILSLAVFGAAIIMVGCHQERNESIRLMNKGLERAKQDKLSQAVDFLQKAAEADPTNHRALYYTGLIYGQKYGDAAKAETFFRQLPSMPRIMSTTIS